MKSNQNENKIKIFVILMYKDNSIDISDGSCNIIDIRSYGNALAKINENRGRHDWLGKFYRLNWQNTTTSEDKSKYRKIGKVKDRSLDFGYHVELTYAEELELWGV